MNNANTPAPTVVVGLLHGALVVGLVLVGGVFFIVQRNQGHLLGSASGVAMALAVLPLVLLAGAAILLRRRIPERRLDETPDAYWTRVDTRGAAIVLWVVTDAAGLLGWIGFLFTGQVAPAGAAALAIVALVYFRPSGLHGAA